MNREREMYERAVARMRDLGEVRERVWTGSDGQPMRIASVEWNGAIKEAAEVIRKWGDLVCETEGFLHVHICRQPAFSYESATVEWSVMRELSHHEIASQIASQEAERCAG